MTLVACVWVFRNTGGTRLGTINGRGGNRRVNIAAGRGAEPRQGGPFLARFPVRFTSMGDSAGLEVIRVTASN